MESSNVQLNAQVATDLEDDFGLIDYASPSLEPTEVADSFEPLPNTAASKLNRGTADDGLIDFEDAESDVVVSEYGGDNGGNGNDEAAGGFGDNSELVDTDTSMADVDIPAPDIVEAESAEPVVTECIESAMTEPVVTEPVEPVMAEFSEPVVIEPVEPVVTESVEPIVAEPVVTEPVVTEPVVTEPAVTEPVKSTDTEAAEVDVTVTDITDVADVADVDVEMIGAELPTSDALAVSASSDPATATIADATVGSSEQTDAEPMDSENDSGVPEMWLRVESEWVPFLGPMQHAYSADDQRCLFGISIADLIDMLQTDCGLTGKDLALEFPSLNVVLDKNRISY
ncbi:hypothetical protein GGF43_000994 [Coemansia sp. RSA 2618]|nr:hypothetical protein GGF43_000994 [Coemansia sp. RSA 2618]